MKKVRKEKLSFGKITLLELNHLKVIKGGEGDPWVIIPIISSKRCLNYDEE
jgi:hypothetical protein